MALAGIATRPGACHIPLLAAVIEEKDQAEWA
jgi:hypothetical protein